MKLALVLGISLWLVTASSYGSEEVEKKNPTFQMGGFLASETVYRANNMASDIGANYTKIPFDNNPGHGVSEFRGTERQSRFSLLAQGEVDSDTLLSGYYELDFLGTSPTANANQSNSYTPRTRHIYMTIDWKDSDLSLLAGQTWSLTTMNSKGLTPRNELIPATIEAQYAVGFNWARQWQVRLVKNWDKKFWLGLSAENAQTVGVAGTLAPGTSNTYQLPAGSLMSANMSMNSYPDLVLKLDYESDFGSYQLYELARNFQSRYGGSPATQTQKQDIWTESFGGGVNLPVIPKTLDLIISGLYGKGIGRYGTTSLPDATFGSDGSLEPLRGAQYLAQLAWHISAPWELYLSYGQESLESSTEGTSGYGDGAVTTNSGCNNLGGTCAPHLKQVTQSNIGFWWSFYKGSFGTAKLGGQYSHTNLEAFADATGFSPSTNQDMVFTSLRYYPF